MSGKGKLLSLTVLVVVALCSTANAATYIIGDSLAVGLRNQPALTGVVNHSWMGIPLSGGMTILPPATVAPKLAVSLYTNNHPGDEAELKRDVLHTLRGRKCVVWATVVTRAPWYRDYSAANRLLYRLAREHKHLRIVPWAETVARRPGLLMDGVHPAWSSAGWIGVGWRIRAELYAKALRSCE